MAKKILFACDLDNTLLISHRHRQPGDICVEHVQGKEQSFMTVKAIELLRRVQKQVQFVPVTTRSLEQYQRIAWPEDCESELAVTTNGAVLLRRGTIDEVWAQQSENVIAPWREELQAQCVRYSEDMDYLRCRIVDDSYLFLCCTENGDAGRLAAECQKHTNLQVVFSGRKIYFFPWGLDKGQALIRLKTYLGCSIAYAAGDSSIDVPMLEKVDRAFAVSDLHELGGDRILLHPPGTIFSEWLLEGLLTECRFLL